MLNKQIPADDDEKADHDFDFIKHDKSCDYSDSEKGIQINVDKIIGSTQGEVILWKNIRVSHSSHLSEKLQVQMVAKSE